MRSARALWLALGIVCALEPALARAGDMLEPTGQWELIAVGTAQTPPMGWNSWNAFHLDLNEASLIASARVLVDQGFTELDYRTVNIDDGWWLRRRQADARLMVRTKGIRGFERDERLSPEIRVKNGSGGGILKAQ